MAVERNSEIGDVPENLMDAIGLGHVSVSPRQPREMAERERQTRLDPYVPPTVLPDPDPRPGLVHRWVRTAIMGDADTRNVSIRMREGWQPCAVQDYPELEGFSDPGGRWTDKGCIEMGGLILCRMTKEQAQSRKDYYQRLSDQQIAGVDAKFAAENDPRMPLLQSERRTRVTFGKD